MSNNINLHQPYTDKQDLKYISKAVESGWVSTSGLNLKNFENEIKNYTKAKYCLALNSGTTALDLSLKCIGITCNDAVLVPSATFISPINVILYNQAEPIFFDTDDYLNINLQDVLFFLKKKTNKKGNYLISKKTGKIIKSIIVVHVFGKPVDVFKLKSFCKKYNIKIIEDASESLGSFLFLKKRKVHTGIIGDIGCISFNGNKIITTGSGGMLLTNKKSYFERALYLSTQSKDDSIFFRHNELGYNYRMNNLSASLGLSQIKKINKILKKKEKDFFIYQKAFKNSKNFEIVGNPTNSTSNNWLNILRIKKNITYKKFSKIIKILHKKKIYVRPIWYPNHLQKHLKKFEKYNLKKIKSDMKTIICLPSSYELKKRDIFYTIKSINQIDL